MYIYFKSHPRLYIGNRQHALTVLQYIGGGWTNFTRFGVRALDTLDCGHRESSHEDEVIVEDMTSCLVSRFVFDPMHAAYSGVHIVHLVARDVSPHSFFMHLQLKSVTVDQRPERPATCESCELT